MHSVSCLPAVMMRRLIVIAALSSMYAASLKSKITTSWSLRSSPITPYSFCEDATVKFPFRLTNPTRAE